MINETTSSYRHSVSEPSVSESSVSESSVSVQTGSTRSRSSQLAEINVHEPYAARVAPNGGFLNSACPICTEPLSESCVLLNCNHRFDTECLSRYICIRIKEGIDSMGQSNPDISCPICRGAIKNAYGEITQSLSIVILTLEDQMKEALGAIDVEEQCYGGNKQIMKAKGWQAIQKVVQQMVVAEQHINSLLDSSDSDAPKLSNSVRSTLKKALIKMRNTAIHCNYSAFPKAGDDIPVNLYLVRQSINTLKEVRKNSLNILMECLPNVYEPSVHDVLNTSR